MAGELQFQTFATFREEMKLLVAPEGLADNLEDYFINVVKAGLSDLQTLLPWYRTFNVNFYQKSDVNEFCSTSIFQGPVGKVTQLFAFKPYIDCKKFFYKRSSPAALECWAERQRCMCPATVPPSEDIYSSPYCNYVIDGEVACGEPYLTGEEDDCRFSHLSDDDRIFSVGPDYKVFAAPRFPCGYLLCLQWQGVRRRWENDDLIPLDQQIKDAIECYAEFRMAKKQHQFDAMATHKQDHALALRMLKYRYTDEQATEFERDCTGSIEQLMSIVRPLYETPIYAP
jgi:hypothetical protein